MPWRGLDAWLRGGRWSCAIHIYKMKILIFSRGLLLSTSQMQSQVWHSCHVAGVTSLFVMMWIPFWHGIGVFVLESTLHWRFSESLPWNVVPLICLDNNFLLVSYLELSGWCINGTSSSCRSVPVKFLGITDRSVKILVILNPTRYIFQFFFIHLRCTIL